jgi:hypothetical protein
MWKLAHEPYRVEANTPDRGNCIRGEDGKGAVDQAPERDA